MTTATRKRVAVFRLHKAYKVNPLPCGQGAESSAIMK